MMNKKIIQTLLLVFSFTIFLFSCNSDDGPVQPVDETETIGHDQWHKVTFILREGHLHGKSFHGNPIYLNSPLKRLQEKEFTLQADGTINASNSEPFYVVPGRNYALEIHYFNKKNELINSTLATEEMAPIHQHFFTTKTYQSLKDNKNYDAKGADLFDYTYRDTDPVDVPLGEFKPNTTLKSVLRQNDPLGFKGYFTIKAEYAEWDMKVQLVHILNGDKYDQQGNTYPPTNPPVYILGTTDLNLDLTFKSITQEPIPTEEGWKTYLQDIANEFNMSFEEVEKLEDPTKVDPESSQYWL